MAADDEVKVNVVDQLIFFPIFQFFQTSQFNYQFYSWFHLILSTPLLILIRSQFRFTLSAATIVILIFEPSAPPIVRFFDPYRF